MSGPLNGTARIHPAEGLARSAWGVVKQTYTIQHGALVLVDPNPLQHDIWAESKQWPPGSDYWPFKAASDVVVLGHAYGTGGHKLRERAVAIRVGHSTKRVHATGTRFIEWSRDGKPRVGIASEVDRVPLDLTHAYGGIDPNVRYEPAGSLWRAIRRHGLPAGAYPRNPFGRGFVAVPDVSREVALPQLEDPDHRLTSENLVAHDPSLWHQQPLPWYLGWQLPATFPRAHYMGAILPLPIPEHEIIEEVRRGLMPESWRGMSGNLASRRPPPAVYHQEAALGLTFSDLKEGTPIELMGMHPEHDTLRFALPPFPRMEIEVGSDRRVERSRLLHVVITPDEERVEITWAAIREELPRTFIVGVHAEIPISLHADGHVFSYEAPETVHARLRRAADARVGAPILPAGAIELSGRLGMTTRGSTEWDRVAFEDAERLGDVDFRTGRVLLREVEWELQGSSSFRVMRHYSSSLAWRIGGLGAGWSHPLEQAVWEQAGDIFYRTEDGRELRLSTGTRGLGLGVRVHDAATGVTVARIASDAYEVTQADGTRARFTRIASSVDAGPPQAKLSQLFTSDGSCLEVRYDVHGRLDRLLARGQARLRFEHDSTGRLTHVHSPAPDGRTDERVVARYAYDAAGQLKEAVDAAGRVSRYAYASGGLLTLRAVDGGGADRFEYDENSRCIAQSSGDPSTTPHRREVSWNPSTRVVGLSNARGDSRTERLDSRNEVIRSLDFFANETAYERDDATGTLHHVRTVAGSVAFLHDSDGHLAGWSETGNSFNVSHDERGRFLESADPDGVTLSQRWDALSRLSAVTAADGGAVVYTYDGDAALERIGLNGDRELRIERGGADGSPSALRLDGASRQANRDALGRVMEVCDENGSMLRIAFDPSGRVDRLIRSDDSRAAYAYSRDGAVTRQHDGGFETRLERDSRDRLLAVEKGNGRTALHRDAEGDVVVIESEALDMWELERDAAGRVIEERGQGHFVLYQKRNAAGAIVRSSCGRSWSTVERDGAGRPTAIEHSDDTFQRFAYTAAGRLARAQDADRVLALSRDSAGRVTRETSEAGVVQSEYGASGFRVRLQAGPLDVRFDRDTAGRLTKLIARARGGSHEQAFVLDRAGRGVARRLPGDVEVVFAHDARGRVTQRELRHQGRVSNAISFAYAGADRPSRIVDTDRGPRLLRHDARGRLFQVGGLIRALDDVGCVYRTLERDDHRYEHGRLVEAYGITYEYDLAGRRIAQRNALDEVTRYRWDGAGRLTLVERSDGSRIAYDYDGIGRLVSRRHETKQMLEGVGEVWETVRSTELVWDGLCVLIERTDGKETFWLREGSQLLVKLGEDGAHAIITDTCGAPTELFDERGGLAWRGVIDLYGQLEPDLARTRCGWHFAGHWRDPETGLLHSWLRVYDPGTGSYLSPNPLGVIAGNYLYGYVDDPLSESSPLGLGVGYAHLYGEVPSERLDAEIIARHIATFDRGDGTLGPARRYSSTTARLRPPDPEELFWGPWAALRPGARRLTRVTAGSLLPSTTCGIRKRPFSSRL